MYQRRAICKNSCSQQHKSAEHDRKQNGSGAQGEAQIKRKGRKRRKGKAMKSEAKQRAAKRKGRKKQRNKW